MLMEISKLWTHLSDEVSWPRNLVPTLSEAILIGIHSSWKYLTSYRSRQKTKKTRNRHLTQESHQWTLTVLTFFLAARLPVQVYAFSIPIPFKASDYGKHF